MSWLKNLFGFGKKEVPEEALEEEVKEEPKEEVSELYDSKDLPKCDYCGMRILPGQKRTMNKSVVHIQCLRQIRKNAKRQAKGYGL